MKSKHRGDLRIVFKKKNKKIAYAIARSYTVKREVWTSLTDTGQVFTDYVSEPVTTFNAEGIRIMSFADRDLIVNAGNTDGLTATFFTKKGKEVIKLKNLVKRSWDRALDALGNVTHSFTYIGTPVKERKNVNRKSIRKRK